MSVISVASSTPIVSTPDETPVFIARSIRCSRFSMAIPRRRWIRCGHIVSSARRTAVAKGAQARDFLTRNDAACPRDTMRPLRWPDPSRRPRDYQSRAATAARQWWRVIAVKRSLAKEMMLMPEVLLATALLTRVHKISCHVGGRHPETASSNLPPLRRCIRANFRDLAGWRQQTLVKWGGPGGQDRSFGEPATRSGASSRCFAWAMPESGEAPAGRRPRPAQ